MDVCIQYVPTSWLADKQSAKAGYEKENMKTTEITLKENLS